MTNGIIVKGMLKTTIDFNPLGRQVMNQMALSLTSSGVNRTGYEKQIIVGAAAGIARGGFCAGGGAGAGPGAAPGAGYG